MKGSWSKMYATWHAPSFCLYLTTFRMQLVNIQSCILVQNFYTRSNYLTCLEVVEKIKAALSMYELTVAYIKQRKKLTKDSLVPSSTTNMCWIKRLSERTQPINQGFLIEFYPFWILRVMWGTRKKGFVFMFLYKMYINTILVTFLVITALTKSF